MYCFTFYRTSQWQLTVRHGTVNLVVRAHGDHFITAQIHHLESHVFLLALLEQCTCTIIKTQYGAPLSLESRKQIGLPPLKSTGT